MSTERVITLLQTAIEEAPGDVALRVRLAELLIEAGEAGPALEQCRAVLDQAPDHAGALAAGQRAAFALGDTVRAGAYQRVLEGLGRTAGSDPPSVAAAPLSAPSDPAAVRSVDTRAGARAAIPAAGPAGQPRDAIDDLLSQVFSEAAGDIERPALTLADVGGLEQVKRRLRTSFLGPLQNPELRRMYGKSLRGGLLLWGPPGCGKTFVARAVAGELGAHFMHIGLHDVLEMWFGKSEGNVHMLFESARRHAPCVLFLDEIDALGQKRSNLTSSPGRNVVVQLLTEMDSLQDNNEGLFILGATNQPWDVDSALRRPGRFDRSILVLPPDRSARRAILEYQLKDRPIQGVDRGGLAERTDGYSGADLKLLCESAAECALEASIQSGTPRPISQEHFEQAITGVRPSMRPWFEVAKNYTMFANRDGVYDELLDYIRTRGY